MQDHSHKLLFMAAAGAMCAMVFYDFQASRAFSVPEGESPSAYGAPGAQPRSQLDDRAGTSLLPERTGESLLPDKAGASVLPNSASCPAADALVSPPRVNDAIGNEPAGIAPIAPAQTGRNANLGTGSACPPLRADAVKPGTVPGLATSGLPQGPGIPAAPKP